MVTSSKVEYVQTGQLVVANYVKNTKAIGFLWGVFSICYAVITLVVFSQPQWVGTNSPTSPGYFSPWKHCAISSVVSPDSTVATPEWTCRGRLDDFSSISNPSMRIATVFTGLAALIACLSVFALVLFVCAPTAVAYNIVSWMQAVAAFCSCIGLVVFPIGWDSPQVKLTCGPEADRFSLGSCGIRWVLVLGILGLLDGAVLSVLGFVLGSRHVKLTAAEYGRGRSKNRSSSSYLPSGYYPTETTSGPPPSLTVSHGHESHQKRPLNLQPILLIPPEIDGYSDFSRSKQALYKAEYATASQQFQL